MRLSTALMLRSLITLAMLAFGGGLALAQSPGAPGRVSLRGSPASVDRAYEAAIARGLAFQTTKRAVDSAAAAGVYVRLVRGSSYDVRGVALPYVLPATQAVLADLGARFRASCGERLVVTGALRLTSRHLANGHRKSVHPTGMAVDLRSPYGRCRRWLRTALRELERAGRVDAPEERRPPHFHLTVFPEPAPASAAGGTRARRTGGVR